MAAERPDAERPAEALLRAGPLTELAAALLGRWLAALPRKAPLRVQAVEIEPQAVVLRVSAGGPGGLELGAQALRIELLRADPASSEWRWRLERAPGLSRVAAWGLGLVPEEAVDRLVHRVLGSGVQVRGERLVLDHAALVARGCRGGSDARG